MLTSVKVGKVSDQLVSVAGVEIYVYIWHLPAPGIQKTLKQQVIADGVQIGYLQAIRYGTAGCASPPWADPDVAPFSVFHKVPDDQKVG